MISIPIAGANISDKRMNKLSSDKSPQDIMLLRNKVTDFFRHGEINNALTLFILMPILKVIASCSLLITKLS